MTVTQSGASPLDRISNSQQRDCRGLRSSVKGVLRKFNVLDLFSRVTAANRVDIFLYHGFCPGSRRDPRFPRLLPIEEFEQHIRIYVRYGMPLRLEQVFQGEASGIVVTFDDGYANNYELAFPVLQKYQFPGTVFLTTGFIDRSVPLWSSWLEFLVMNAQARNSIFEWGDTPIILQLGGPALRLKVLAELNHHLRRLPISEIHQFLRALEAHLSVSYCWNMVPNAVRPLSWDQVRAMFRTGLVSFGCHTVSHPVLSLCNSEQQRFEILESKRRVAEELGEECLTFAYPYGKSSDYTEVTTQIVGEAGFELALTTQSGSTRPSSCDRQQVNRWGADGISSDDLSFLVAGGPLISGQLKKIGKRED